MKQLSEFFPFALSLLLFLVFATEVSAEMRVPSLIGYNMVLQQGTKVRIWGTGAPGEHVTVAFATTTSKTTANQQGRWQTFIGPFKAGGPFVLTITGSNHCFSRTCWSARSGSAPGSQTWNGRW